MKFGRVRFKVIMLQNRPEGEQVYKENKFNQKNPSDKKDLTNNQVDSYRNTLSEDEDRDEDQELEEDERIVPEDEMAMHS